MELYVRNPEPREFAAGDKVFWYSNAAKSTRYGVVLERIDGRSAACPAAQSGNNLPDFIKSGTVYRIKIDGKRDYIVRLSNLYLFPAKKEAEAAAEKQSA